MAGYKVKEEEKVVRAQHIKSCKRVYKLFWNQFEDEEEAQDLKQMRKHKNLFFFSELNLIEVMQDQLDRER